MIALLFALLVTDPPATPPASPPVVSGGSPAARADDPPTVPVPFPCLVGTPSGGTTLPPNSPVLQGGGTMSTSNGNEAGVASGSLCPRPASLMVAPTVTDGTETATTPPPVRSGGGAASASYAAGLAVAPADPTPGAASQNPATEAQAIGGIGGMAGGGSAGSTSYPAGRAVAPSEPGVAPGDPLPSEHVISPCPPPSLGSGIHATTGNEAGTSSGGSHCPRPGLALGAPTVSVRTGAPSVPGPDTSSPVDPSAVATQPVRSGGGAASSSYAAGRAVVADDGRDGPRRVLGLSRRQWGWIGAVVGAVVLGVIVSDDDGGSTPVGPDGR